MRILLVEDDRSLANAITRILVRAGYSVEWAADGEMALTLGLDESFAAILLDMVLPRRSGWEVLETLRSAGVNSPILVLTVWSEPEASVRSLTLGADDHVGKPFDPPELVARIGALIRRSGRTEARHSDVMLSS